MCNSKAIALKNCEYYLKIHQISTRHSLLSFLCKHILAPFLDKFGDSKGTLIKRFVDENTDFFREDMVMMEWLNVLEMSVKFENEEVEPKSLRGGHRRALKSNDSDARSKQNVDSAQSSPKKAKSARLKEMTQSVYEKLERRRKKYKKRQIEAIGWHYTDINETKSLELLSVITPLQCNDENIDFYSFIKDTAYPTMLGSSTDLLGSNIIDQYVKPVLMNKHGAPLMTPSLKCLYVYIFYRNLCLSGNYDSLLKPDSLLAWKHLFNYHSGNNSIRYVSPATKEEKASKHGLNIDVGEPSIYKSMKWRMPRHGKFTDLLQTLPKDIIEDPIMTVSNILSPEGVGGEESSPSKDCWVCNFTESYYKVFSGERKVHVLALAQAAVDDLNVPTKQILNYKTI